MEDKIIDEIEEKGIAIEEENSDESEIAVEEENSDESEIAVEEENSEKKINPVKPEFLNTSGFAGKSFTHNGKNYGFNMPASEFKNERGVYVPYTYEEVLEDENLQKRLAELCDNEETCFVKILN